ncbi:hypothetical protein [Clostridium felsineum]|uniref:Uncharacterized protein n=1 Tax=Clostridium felsineum TaxID=36839 RepID=A0A1S8LWQ1_9CLOT|nr:hypothetical protein [Clostridium felsineum]URZ05923.1 hypothetical protein CLROS_012550 [Clostridium felsineum]URZ10960.1 hypothetical protein CROST_016760 [Clostridium felsineum]
MTKEDIPFYEECTFGYYEWFVRKEDNEIVICKVATLAPFKRIIDDKSYELDIKYSVMGQKHKGKFLNRSDAYELVRKYWTDNCSNNYLGYLKIRI